MKRWFFRARSNLWFALLFAPGVGVAQTAPDMISLRFAGWS